MSDIIDDNIKYGMCNLITIAGLCTSKAVLKKFSKTEKENIPKFKKTIKSVIYKNTTLRENNVRVKNLNLFGKSPYYEVYSKTVGVDMKKCPLSVFHELGHAYIYNKYPIVKQIPSTRKLEIISIVAMLFPLIVGLAGKYIKNEKIEDGISNTAPYIAGGILLPEIINEALASYKGAQFAKPLLNKKLYGRMNTCNIAALFTYILPAVIMIISTKIMQNLSEVLKEYNRTSVIEHHTPEKLKVNSCTRDLNKLFS